MRARTVVLGQDDSLLFRDLLFRDLLWYQTCGDRLVRLVVVRDPNDHQHDDFFICSNPELTPDQVATAYYDRWSIETGFRDTKQLLGAENPQSWIGKGPELIAALSCFTYSAVWDWFLAQHSQVGLPLWPNRPWYSQKTTPSFADALASLRRHLWQPRIFGTSGRVHLTHKNARALLDILAEAA